MCHNCGGKLKKVITDLPFKIKDNSIVIIKKLPVLQCLNCNEYLIEDSVMEKVDCILSKIDKTAEVEILSYAVQDKVRLCVDIAVYFKPEERRLEWEEKKEFPGVTEIWAETEKILGENVDILVLNKAPSLIAFDALRTGIPLVIKDGLLYLRFLLFISSAAIGTIKNLLKITGKSNNVQLH